MYSDDTQMSLAILRSLKAKNSFDAEHLAKEFTTDYFENGLHRCYGGSIGRVFSSLRMANYKDPYAHAADLFNGTGSYGNGGAMRIAPAALYGLRYPKREFEKIVIDITRLTHTNPLAICGALIQAYAIQLIFSLIHDHIQLDYVAFIDNLLKRLERTEYFVDFKQPNWLEALDAYKEKLQIVKYLLIDDKQPSVTNIVHQLGSKARTYLLIQFGDFFSVRPIHLEHIFLISSLDECWFILCYNTLFLVVSGQRTLNTLRR
ncbi:unnamed protein product [Schistosoma curassoni]|uniref:ADP-ribosylhydrolase ARH3 n=1 Tax=Schistosoma curassoni TaxID=6186 RepID=A0A183KKY6_9TREM|nr:unnamed protein product [Schistosoma curassoni]